MMLGNYFSGIRMRFSTHSYTIDWINLEIGIAMGCTISPILLVMAMEVILKAAGPENLSGGCYMLPLKAFMNDATIICSNEDETHRMLERLGALMVRCRVKFKAKKSRTLSKERQDRCDDDIRSSQSVDTIGQSRTS